MAIPLTALVRNLTTALRTGHPTWGLRRAERLPNGNVELTLVSPPHAREPKRAFMYIVSVARWEGMHTPAQAWARTWETIDEYLGGTKASARND